MSKRDLKKYLNELNKEQLRAGPRALEKFSPVKVYYNFVLIRRKKVFAGMQNKNLE
jgi:hypothetical protein